MTHDPNCSYCTKSETLQLLMVEVAEMPASTVYFWRNGRYPGRCVVALKGHERELFHLTPARRRQFMDEVSAVAEAIQAAFHADKINYAVYGDVVSHVHVHLVPKQKDGPEWGVPFTINPDVPDAMSEEEIQSCLATLRARLGQARAETH